MLALYGGMKEKISNAMTNKENRDILQPDRYVHLRYRLAESTDGREIWRYESLLQRFLPERMAELRAKNHDRFAFRLLHIGELWWVVP